MTSAGQRTILDADSHVMELPGFLDDFLEPAQRGRLNRDGLGRRTKMIDDAVAEARARSVYPERAARARERLLLDKGWHAMGASRGAASSVKSAQSTGLPGRQSGVSYWRVPRP